MNNNMTVQTITPNPASGRGPAATLATLVAALVLAGCSMAPKYERPAAPVAATFPQAPAGKAGQATAADIGWRDFFADARLKRLIEIALDNNRDLSVSLLNVQRAQAQYRIQRAAQLPTVNLGLNSTRQSPGSASNSATFGVGVTSYELDLFGRIQSLKDAALATYLAQDATRKSAQISLVSSVATGYLSLLADDQLLQITRDTLKTREESFKLTQLRFDNGVNSELDLRQSEGLVESARADLAQLERQRAQDFNALLLLLGTPNWPADVPLDNGGNLDGQTSLLAQVPVGLPSSLLVKRPDIEAVEQQLISANANIGAARAAFFPRISLTGQFGRASTSLSNLFDRLVRGWSFAPSVTLPIFDFGANQANLDVAKVDRDIAVAQYEKSIQTAFREVADALAGSATWDEQLRATRAQVQAAQTTFKLSDLRYRNGVASYLDLLDAQRTLYTAQQTAIQVQLSQLSNQITLYKTLGGGWQADSVAGVAGSTSPAATVGPRTP
ncbi:MAG: Outer membrane protein OprM [Paracidovorax wautersii]|uniref:Outer membrane protein OprM n=1 Tax=Paracidovorax wautersii TaxID=1177982 RepID=A0A7V8FMK5_9BURK|nr:MAG: Outer membrane protein OprM [Paracidovorax wautersii]